MLRGSGPSGNIQALAIERRARRVGSSDKAGTIAF
jgi:hypothetical protein